MSGGFDCSGEIDPGNHGKASHDRRLTGDCQSILVVERGPLDAHVDVAIHEIGFVEIDKSDLLAGLGFLDHDGFHQRPDDRGQRTDDR